MEISFERMDGVISEIYAAVGNPDGFDGALRGVVDMLDGSSGMLFTPLNGQEEGGFGYVDHFDVALWERFRFELREASPWEQAGERRQLMRTGMTATDEFLVPEDVLRKTAFYHEAHVPLDVGRLCCAVVAGDGDASLPRTYLSIYRGIAARAFNDAESRVLQHVAAHMRRALQLAHRLGFAEAERAALRELLHDLACGIAILDRNRSLLFMNRSAERLCTPARGLSARRGKSGVCALEAANARENAALQRAIEHVLRPPGEHPPGGESASADPLIIHGPQGLDPLVVTVIHLPARLSIAAEPGVVLVIEDPVSPRPAAEQLFAGLFAMTPAECRIARALLAGEAPKQIAERLGISENTVRTHIKSLHTKTATRSLAALTALLARTGRSVLGG